MLRSCKNLILNSYIRLCGQGVKIGERVAIELGAYLRGQIRLGKKVQIFGDVRLSGTISIGDYSYVNYSSHLLASPEFGITIGKYSCLARNTFVSSTNNHHSDAITTYPIGNVIPGFKNTDAGAPVEIGHDVWVGANVVILPGVKIGHGAIIGANSVLTAGTVVGAYEIWAGTPAKKISQRFDAATAQKLLTLEWWNWDEKTIRAHEELFNGPLTSEKLSKI